ncbi:MULTISPECIES: KpsF/GutQ family sugar-phosphate isomerase [Chlamydia]|uniref:KpsF/GutQ family sugar-phosphate isomerase n=1 Tax=Chlamydophila parapsittaci TaxID=344886 RepID=A0ABX5VY53_9CHLA|nr:MULTISPECIES: KpsF/GutQ family sugar-phosphate isomerase [Chlamydia]EPJ32348.1 sugar isomerase, KpsF/GutQ family protein [Chlamydia psittaci 06-1683]EPP32248.1 sugar isomerase, KpsF/GutQ family protein [Chlamydia psittaci C1/97]AFS20338.1 sugar isomerase, KpsF/GutQ family protein [Chlamydia psittaci GR9]AFS23980.1 sugar isomerase, KpsF/GutQ family protein [Chlamydia psittaci WS/RT/E30]EPP28468.1 sugar isomerase, KpsF/GutQ family protein [Chlamydia psittaci 08-2626_L3]
MRSPTTSIDLCQDIVSKQRESLERFFDTFQCEDTWVLAEKILNHQGSIFFSGVGKSGCIARKIVATLQSFGERALFLASGDLLHGDLGVVRPGDIVCLFSKSGETRELLECIPYLKERGVFIAGITSATYSSLAVLCDHVVILPMIEELDPFNLVPTTSTTCQLLFGDLLAITLLRSRQISLADYGKNHPGGQIGLKVIGKIRDYMFPKTEVPFCSPEDTIADSLDIFSSYGCGCVCIVNEKFEILGIFTDGDLRRSLTRHGGDILSQRLKDVMTPNPRVISEDADVLLGLQMMETGSPVTILPVVDAKDQKYVVGLLQMHTLAKAGLI